MPNLASLLNPRRPQLGGVDLSAFPVGTLGALFGMTQAAPQLGGMNPAGSMPQPQPAMPQAPGAMPPPVSPPAHGGQPPQPAPAGQPSAMPGSLGALGQPSAVNLGVDPQAAMKPTNLGDLSGGAVPHGHKGLFPGKDWKTLLPLLLGVIGDGMTAYGGGQPIFGPAMIRRKEAERQQGYDLEKLRAEEEAKHKALFDPHPEQVGNTVGIFDPGNRKFDTVFTAPSLPEQYASALGLQPGSPEYEGAVKDYRLGAWSDPAMANRSTLEGIRYDNKHALQGQRLAVTVRGQDLSHGDRVSGQSVTRRGQDLVDSRSHDGGNHGGRGSPHKPTTEGAVYADIADRFTKGLPVNPRESQWAKAYEARHTPKGRHTAPAPSGGSHNEAVAVGPNGQKLVVRGGKWVDSATGKPVQ